MGAKTTILSISEIITKFRERHGGKYDYSKVDYKGYDTAVCIICPKHGEFWQRPDNHLYKKYGCPACAKEAKRKGYNAIAGSLFINKASKLHNGKYDYSEVVYKGCDSLVTIICPVHGRTRQTPSNHLSSKGGGCEACGIEARTKNRMLPVGVWLERFSAVHGNKFDYSKVVYKGSERKIEIICPIHGGFWQRPDNHASGATCQKCAGTESKIESEFSSWLKSLLPVHTEVRRNDRKAIKGELDVYIKDLSLAFEFNGLYWHSSANISDNSYHRNKSSMCSNKGIRLIHIWEDDWIYRKDIVKSFVSSTVLPCSTSIPARKTNFVPISRCVANEFLETNHIQGSSRATHRFGLFNNGRLVSVSTFIRRGGVYELNRLACLLNTRVLGALGKHTKNFQKLWPSSVISFCDLSMYTGDSYVAAGFKVVSFVAPDYKYVIGKHRVHKFNFRRRALPKFLGDKFDPAVSEIRNMENNGFYRLYDCGKLKFRLDCSM